MHIQILTGSIREGRKAKPIGDWVYRIAAKREDLSAELIDLKDWNLPMFDLPKGPIMGDYEDALQQRWADKISQGDGYLSGNQNDVRQLDKALNELVWWGNALRNARARNSGRP